MKKIFLFLLCLSFVAAGSAHALDAFGSAFGNLQTARTLNMGEGEFGGAVGIADATSVFGSFTYGVAQDVDFRFKAGLIDAGGNSDARFTFGTDFKYQLWRVTPTTQGQTRSKYPFDLALGGMFEYVKDIWQIGGFATGSYPFALQNGMTISPYGRLNVRLQNYHYDVYNPATSRYEGNTESDIKFGLNGGVSLKMTETVTAFGELQLDGNDGLFLGLNFLVM